MGGGDDAELRALPPVHELAAAAGRAPCRSRSRRRAGRSTSSARSLRSGGPASRRTSVARADARDLAAHDAASLRPVINATGVIVHTNLGPRPAGRGRPRRRGRAPPGTRTSSSTWRPGRAARGTTTSTALLCELTGAEAAMVVNNGAGAVLLAVGRAGRAGPRRSIVSRGQLVEIGGGFRIPDVIAQSGSTLVEVGTTNRTHARDYERALWRAERTGRARSCACTSRTSAPSGSSRRWRSRSCAGSALPVDRRRRLRRAGRAGRDPRRSATSRDLRRSVAAGAALVCCSGDKLLGGPQAGLLVGRADARRRRARASAGPRAADRQAVAGRAGGDAAPVPRSRHAPGGRSPCWRCSTCAEEVLADAGAAAGGRRSGRPRRSCAAARVGGGALPLLELEGPAVALDRTAMPRRAGGRPARPAIRR